MLQLFVKQVLQRHCETCCKTAAAARNGMLHGARFLVHLVGLEFQRMSRMLTRVNYCTQKN